ncbi:MAG: radical SAM family heme chaperone HemW [Campylobacterota bacterium]|nr:radical SAM family heme chaperone HemW [Campylobacterota bacterium]
MLLYIHIPFCDSKCFYCAFNSYTSLHSLRKDYMKSLKIQLKYELEKQDKIVETIFIGGGTPSCVDALEYKEVIDIIKPYMAKNIEITIEANPNSATFSWLNKIYEIGINRVSFGVQTFDDEKLRFLGRNHNKRQAIEAIENASKIGFENINMDIIYDTSLDTKELLDSDLSIIKSLAINHISAYSLTLEEGTKFYNKSSVKIENEKLANYLFKQLADLGFSQYEISNFALNDDARSKHNLGYWEYKEYLGIGCGAVGCIDDKRYYGIKDVQQYIATPLEYEDIEPLSDEDIVLEKILLGFRSVVGVRKDILNDKQKLNLQQLIYDNKVILKDNKIFNNDYMLADELALYL